MSTPTYNRIGLNYTDFRRPDPRIEAAIWAALGDARSVVNVGAGAGCDRLELFLERDQGRLRADLESGRWDERHGRLRTLPELDIGLRLVRAEL